MGSKSAPTADVAVGPILGPTHLTQQKKKRRKIFKYPDRSSLPISSDQIHEREREGASTPTGNHHHRRRRSSHLLSTAVLPLLHRRRPTEKASIWTIGTNFEHSDPPRSGLVLRGQPSSMPSQVWGGQPSSMPSQGQPSSMPSQVR